MCSHLSIKVLSSVTKRVGWRETVAKEGDFPLQSRPRRAGGAGPRKPARLAPAERLDEAAELSCSTAAWEKRARSRSAIPDVGDGQDASRDRALSSGPVCRTARSALRFCPSGRAQSPPGRAHMPLPARPAKQTLPLAGGLNQIRSSPQRRGGTRAAPSRTVIR
jgi:hypothetical protein